MGDTDASPEPDDLDLVCCQPLGDPSGSDRWIAVMAVSGTYVLRQVVVERSLVLPDERSSSWVPPAPAGTRQYLWRAAGRLREHGQDRLASVLETEMLASRLVWLELTTIAESLGNMMVNARQYDISDETLLANMLAAVRDRDWRRHEGLRQRLGLGAVDALVAEYWKQSGWIEKAMVASFAYDTYARDRSHAGLREMSLDLLGIPDQIPGIHHAGDTPREARSKAITWLDGNDDPDYFVRLYEDDEAQAAGIARHRHPSQ